MIRTTKLLLCGALLLGCTSGLVAVTTRGQKKLQRAFEFIGAGSVEALTEELENGVNPNEHLTRKTLLQEKHSL